MTFPPDKFECMTVGELIDQLQAFDRNLPIIKHNDHHGYETTGSCDLATYEDQDNEIVLGITPVWLHQHPERGYSKQDIRPHFCVCLS
jgi:hypothetical protein